MSTFEIVIIADLPSEADGENLIDHVEATLNAIDPTQANSMDSRVDPGPLGIRVSIDVPGAVIDDNEEQLFQGLSSGRAALCVDGDEYGVTFSAWKLTDDRPQCVYLSHLNDPDLDDDNDDPSVTGRIQVGEPAIRNLADLYGVATEPLRDIENDPTLVTDNLGTVGEPFDPWLNALNLDWPQL